MAFPLKMPLISAAIICTIIFKVFYFDGSMDVCFFNKLSDYRVFLYCDNLKMEITNLCIDIAYFFI